MSARSIESTVALRDGTALSLSAAITGVMGLLCWVVTAATLPQAAVGETAAFVSGFILVAGIAQLNVGLGIMRWLPRAGSKAKVLAWRGYLTVGIAAGVVAIGFLILTKGSQFGSALFVAASVCWALFQLQDAVLAALGRAVLVPVFNGIFGAARVLVVPVLGSALGTTGVLVSWIAPTVVMLLVASIVITTQLLRRDSPGTLPGRREVVSFLAPTYVATLGTTLLYNSVPLLVVHKYGAELGATFFMVWTAVNAADYAISGFVNSLVLRGSSDAGVLRSVAGRLALLVGCGVAVGLVLAPVALSLFGPAYVEQGTSALRVLLLAMLVRPVVALAVGARLAAGHGRTAAMIQAASTSLVMLGVLVAPAGAGLLGPALGFLIAQAAVATVTLPGLASRMR